MRRSALFALLLLAPAAAGQNEKPPVMVPVMKVSIRLDALLSAEPLKGLRAAVASDMPNFTQSVETDLGYKPLDFVRLSLLAFGEEPAREYARERPVLVRTVAKPIDLDGFLRATGGHRLDDSVGIPGHPGAVFVEPADRGDLHALVGPRLVTMPNAPSHQQARRFLAGLMAQALDWDTEAGKETAVLVATADGTKLPLLLSDRDRKEMPDLLRPLLAAGAGRLTVHLRPAGPARTGRASPGVVVRGTATFADDKQAAVGEAAARSLLELVGGFLAGGRQETTKEFGKSVGPLFDFAAALLKSARATTDGATVTLTASADLTPALSDALRAMPKSLEEVARRSTSLNNLKQFGLAMHNYHDVEGHFPANVHDAAGKPLLSWRVQLLPYTEHAALYKRFKLDEPWDSDHNKKLLPLMPKVYAVPGAKADPGRTFYQCFIGKKNARPNPLLIEGGAKRTMTTFTDGTSNTLMVVEAAEAVEWTKPADLPFTPDGPLPKLGGHFPKGFLAGFCDGSVRFLPADLKAETLRALITADGGEVVDLP